MIKQAIIKAISHANLSESEMQATMEEMLNGQAPSVLIGSFLTALRMKGETVEEITAAARMARGCARRIDVSDHLVNLDREEINIDDETILDTCGTATSFFTSFGYFDDAGNAATMESVARALVPGGAFLLDFLNAVAVEAHIVPESREERHGRTYHVRRRIDDDRVVKDVVIEEEGLTLSYSESVRLYSHHELVNLLKASGLSAVASFGAFDGRDFTTDAPRCIVVARKTRAA